MWNLATTPTWSDLIHITVWRNNEFLHSFRNLSKSNAFAKNLTRTMLILHKISFRMSILSNSKTSWIFYNLRWNNCKKPFMGGHDCFEEKGASDNKNRYNSFFQKNNIFRNNCEKYISRGITIFQGIGCRTSKIIITFSMNYRILFWSFFLKKSPYRLNESKKTCFGGPFSLILVVLLSHLFPKTIGVNHV